MLAVVLIVSIFGENVMTSISSKVRTSFRHDGHLKNTYRNGRNGIAGHCVNAGNGGHTGGIRKASTQQVHGSVARLLPPIIWR